MTDETFPSRVDAWLVVVVVGAVALVAVEALSAFARSPLEGWLNLGFLAGMLALVLLVAYPCSYTLTATQLVIRAGLVRWRIDYADITGVEPSRSLWSAPALSLRRVKVSYAGRFQLVSPRDRERFIAALNERVSAARRRPT